MDKVFLLIGKVLLSILIGLLSFLTIAFLMLWGVLYRDENKKGYVGKKGSSFKETANIFYGGLYWFYLFMYYIIFDKEIN
jgi:hypothetical protein